jgi:hypothetical protein
MLTASSLRETDPAKAKSLDKIAQQAQALRVGHWSLGGAHSHAVRSVVPGRRRGITAITVVFVRRACRVSVLSRRSAPQGRQR